MLQGSGEAVSSMEATEIVATGVAAATSDITLWSMFWQAAFVVKLVMLGLLGASIWCWGIIIDKSMLYARTQAAMDRFEDVFWSGQSLEELYNALSARPGHATGALFVAAAPLVQRRTLPRPAL